VKRGKFRDDLLDGGIRAGRQHGYPFPRELPESGLQILIVSAH
jgi:hypothetical protein